MIPAPFVERDERHTGFNESPSQKRPLSECIAAVTIADFAGLAVNRVTEYRKTTQITALCGRTEQSLSPGKVPRAFVPITQVMRRQSRN